MKGLAKWVVVVLLLAQLFSLSVVGALASPGTENPYNPELSAEEIQQHLGLTGDVEVLTDDQMSQLIRVCHAVGAYLVRNPDGTLSLTLQDGSRVGVDRTFLNNYRTGLREINQLIRMGWLTVDDNFDLQPGSALPTSATAIEEGLKQVEEQVAGEDPTALADGLPESAEPNNHYYSGGLLFSFNSRRFSVPYGYASFGPTFASYYRLGRYGARFSLLFRLNRHFFQRTYGYGGYGYIPYSVFYHRHGYNLFYYYPYYYGRYARWYYTYLWY